MSGYEKSLIAIFDEACDKFQSKTALIYLGEEFSYIRLRKLVDRFARGLLEMGVESNDKILMYLNNCPQWIIAYYAALRIGAVLAPISPIYTVSEIKYLINDCGAETVICQDTNVGYVREVFEETCLKRAIVTNYAELLPAGKRIVGALFDAVPKGKVQWTGSVVSFKKLLFKHEPDVPTAKVDPNTQLAWILYTGGTTGFPKGCPSSHSDIASCIMDMKEVVENYVSEGADILVFAAPLFHGFGQFLLPAIALTKGNPIVLMPLPMIDAILDAIQRYKGTLFLGVPTLYRMVLENDRLEQYDLRSLRYCWSGADVLPAEVLRRWREVTGVPIYQGYGASEIGFAAMSPLDREPGQGCIGRPIASREIQIVDPETLQPVAPGEVGETLIRSDTMWGSYWKKPDETADSYVEVGGRKWYRTKDYCKLDGEGQLHFVDRAVDIIKYKGYRVAASEIEAVLQDPSAVIEAVWSVRR